PPTPPLFPYTTLFRSRAPSRYSPTNNLAQAQNRANTIIGVMEEVGYLTSAEADAARQNPARLSAAAEARAGGYFADWVMTAGPRSEEHTSELQSRENL